MDNTELLNALKNEFSASVIPVYLNSLEKEVGFREISVLEQKVLSKTIIANEERSDVIYDAQIALMQKLCLDDTLDISTLTEFDRIKILLELYQSNFKSNTIEMECPVCKNKTEFKLDFDKTIKNLNKIKLIDYNITEKNSNHEITFTVNFPSIRRLQEYRAYQTKLSSKYSSAVQDFSFDMIDLFIKKIKIKNLKTDNVTDIDVYSLAYSDYMDILDIIPQDFLYSNKSKVAKLIRDKITQPLEDAFVSLRCPHCNNVIKSMGSINSFFTL